MFVMLQVLQYFYLIGVIWLILIIFVCQHFVVAGAIADWYFKRSVAVSSFLVLVYNGTSSGRLLYLLFLCSSTLVQYVYVVMLRFTYVYVVMLQSV